ncbi:queuosine biosynthesis protein QueC [Clostridium botulinum C str. Eklund]|nr:queuosine biosynthesis protein QueC [Clostridium botulinum C str. Eklund]
MAYDFGVLDIIKNETLTCYNGVVENILPVNLEKRILKI